MEQHEDWNEVLLYLPVDNIVKIIKFKVDNINKIIRAIFVEIIKYLRNHIIKVIECKVESIKIIIVILLRSTSNKEHQQYRQICIIKCKVDNGQYHQDQCCWDHQLLD